MRKGDYNQRLYFVRSGRLKGLVENTDGSLEEVMRIGEDQLIGVYSFFSKTFASLSTIKAVTDCELAYIDKHTPCLDPDSSIEKEFMPMAVMDLNKRQKRMLEISYEKQQISML